MLKIEISPDTPPEELRVLSAVQSCSATADDADTTAPNVNTSQSTPTDSAPSVDTDNKGVKFDPAYCGRAKVAFYTTGPRTGQWKRRQGVDDAAYNSWYARQLTGDPVDTADEEAVASLFKRPYDTPNDCLLWVTEQVKSGRVAEHAHFEALTAEGLAMADLFNPDPDAAERTERAMTAIYDALSK